MIEETHLPVPEPVAEPCLQLVRFDDGRLGLRLAHYHGRRWGRDPLVLIEDDLPDLRRALGETPGIAQFLAGLVDPAPRRPR